ncbi:hypothetical protein TWF730_005654 [Orbilia blumenaviensis]|uniref:Uncharacterized protein n=1 Tax=Orbilia blumenaviensis TaxID=1796055 RepID=A0AAV9VL59_9PEZI
MAGDWRLEVGIGRRGKEAKSSEKMARVAQTATPSSSFAMNPEPPTMIWNPGS